jgi:hypothetical protein
LQLAPEIRCLETQEKYWKGKLKEMCDRYEKEERRLKNILDELEDESDY